MSSWTFLVYSLEVNSAQDSGITALWDPVLSPHYSTGLKFLMTVWINNDTNIY